ncbi:tRNA (guanosine(37)-N1)-methyltransferase TrmD [Parapusillimonas granuli]|uniref:tRNA (guanine-N(1)-)-methyltransferase n=1 Tax=Parapusillimonas granuli TaxID=380911 RepID=A0A853FVY9_9BURK|nr:tRNA (guanosine(37)-N1)-methyltransferase TrmD [Parapusillimonas granuli]MBB5217032.1 tRNA (guanine37-N1)-methyltransferase [Parapusillimonas granuli]MEB2400638.1 tRNA (guanosine(37)-N1)-methyltransferase TrmD [Alcaligenaceae bacterium]NYT50204.1 tRNA (guanosine(37)-N1)-methyltransferase TrmD [Parapusillimonas granuli]
MRFDVVSLFPDMFSVVSELGVTGRARKQGVWSIGLWNPRDFTHDAHRTVDDRPYGGGPGMVMLAEPLEDAVRAARAGRADGDSVPVVLMSPTGRRYNQALAEDMARGAGAILVCGRYEGVDQRFIDRCVTDEISMGDFVLSGGEIAALAIIDSVVRLLPGVLNDAESARQDSFNQALTGLLDSPHYTRPECHQGLSVPAELLSGHHSNIAAWRRRQSLALTAARRPDLILAAREAGLLSRADEEFLKGLGGGMA